MDTLIIAVVVVIAVLAHVALYRWVRFKIHEGVIAQFLRDSAELDRPHRSAADIAAHTALPRKRVDAVCGRSHMLSSPVDTPGHWRVS